MRVAGVILNVPAGQQKRMAGSAVVIKKFEIEKLGLEEYETFVNGELLPKPSHFLISSKGIVSIYHKRWNLVGGDWGACAPSPAARRGEGVPKHRALLYTKFGTGLR